MVTLQEESSSLCQTALAASLRTGKNGLGTLKRTLRSKVEAEVESNKESKRIQQSVEVTDDDMAVILDTGDIDEERTAKRTLFSRKLHYLVAQLVKESARLVVRQNVESNGFETWRRHYNRFALPDATRTTSLLTQLLDFRFNPATFEQDFNTWETLKVKYERQTGAELLDGVLVATSLNKT